MIAPIIIISAVAILGLCTIAKTMGHNIIIGLAWSFQALSFAALAYGVAVVFSLL
jgi:hypothetical protein